MNAASTRLLALSLTLALAACASQPRDSGPQASIAGPGEGPAPGSRQASTSAEPGLRPGAQEDLARIAGDRVFFAFDSAELDVGARSRLEAQAAWLRRHPAASAVVAGSADERGTREYNLALGARRAAAARRHLVLQGVPAAQLKTVSWGKERPLDPGATEDAWARNRNAQTLVEETLPAAEPAR